MISQQIQLTFLSGNHSETNNGCGFRKKITPPKKPRAHTQKQAFPKQKPHCPPPARKAGQAALFSRVSSQRRWDQGQPQGQENADWAATCFWGFAPIWTSIPPLLEAPRPPSSWELNPPREADHVCRVSCSNGPARGIWPHPSPAQPRFQSTAISRDDLTPQDTVETATISNCSGKGSTQADGYRENCTLTNLTTSRKCQTTALQHALPQGSAGRVRVSKRTVRAVT